MKVGFCGSCRRLILADFSYCPYCGVELSKKRDFADSVEEPFARIERRTLERVVNERIGELESQLDTMELELESLISARGSAEAQPPR